MTTKLRNTHITNDDFRIETLEIQQNSSIKIEFSNSPFIYQESGQLLVSEFDVYTNFEYLMFLIDNFKNNIFLKFLFFVPMKKDSLKVCLKKFNIHLHDNLVLSSNLTYNFVKNVQTLNFTQFYLYFNGKFPIISDQIIQFVHQNKSEFDSINIFMSPLDINISFEELPIVYNYFMKIKSKFQNLEKIFCIYFNLTKFYVNFGVKSNN